LKKNWVGLLPPKQNDFTSISCLKKSIYLPENWQRLLRMAAQDPGIDRSDVYINPAPEAITKSEQGFLFHTQFC
jgi:hypothetical protein